MVSFGDKNYIFKGSNFLLLKRAWGTHFREFFFTNTSWTKNNNYEDQPQLQNSKPKKDGTWRMCVDFRAVKEISVKNRYPIPCINDLLGYLKDANYFTKLDCEVFIIRFRL